MDNIRKISDMYLAAALLSYGATLDETDRSEPRRQKFCFKNDVDHVFILDNAIPVKRQSPTISEIETLFVSKRLMFPPNYPDSVRGIKSLIHST